MPVPVDADGLMVERGIALAPDARVVAVTPAHQSPLSISLSLPRRHALLEWAAQAGAWVVEDDYDGEYRYASRPLPALASLDRQGRVLYATQNAQPLSYEARSVTRWPYCARNGFLCRRLLNSMYFWAASGEDL